MMAKDDLLRLARGYWAAKALLSACELDLFSVLAAGPATEADLRERLGLHERAVRDWLDALVGLGLLTYDGKRYANAADADDYLDAAKPTYLGGFMKLLNFHYRGWGGLTDLLRTGESASHGAQNFDVFYSDPTHVKQFMQAMDGAIDGIGPSLATAFDWAGCTSFADIGGARGQLAADIAKAHPHLRAVTYDLPQVEPVFHDHMAEIGAEGRVTFHAGDFFTEPLPEADVLVFGHVLHDWDDEKRIALLAKAYDALAPGGRVLVYDAVKDEEPGAPDNFLMSLNMRLRTPGGSEYTASQARAWLTETGFTGVTVQPLTGPDSMIVGTKAAS